MGGERELDLEVTGGSEPDCDAVERWLTGAMRSGGGTGAAMPPGVRWHLDLCDACRAERDSATLLPVDLSAARAEPPQDDPMWVNSVMAQVRGLPAPRRHVSRAALRAAAVILGASILAAFVVPRFMDRAPPTPSNDGIVEVPVVAPESPAWNRPQQLGGDVGNGIAAIATPAGAAVGQPPKGVVDVIFQRLLEGGSPGDASDFVDRAPANCEWISPKMEPEEPEPGVEVF